MCIEFHRAAILIWVRGRAMEGPRIRCRWCEERFRAPRQEHKFIDCLWTPQPATVLRGSAFGARDHIRSAITAYAAKKKTFPTRACNTGARMGKGSWRRERLPSPESNG